LFRSFGSALLLALGYGLLSMGVIAFLSQATAYILSYCSFRRMFPCLRLSRMFISWRAFRDLASYGIHTFLANIGAALVNYITPLLIAHFLPVAYVGYYNLPVRLLQYAAEVVARVGLITSANAAELQARGDAVSVARLGIYSNRYCFVLYVPFTIFL